MRNDKVGKKKRFHYRWERKKMKMGAVMVLVF